MSSTPRFEPCWPVYASLEKEAGASSAGDCLALRGREGGRAVCEEHLDKRC